MSVLSKTLTVSVPAGQDAEQAEAAIQEKILGEFIHGDPIKQAIRQAAETDPDKPTVYEVTVTLAKATSNEKAVKKAANEADKKIDVVTGENYDRETAATSVTKAGTVAPTPPGKPD